MRVNPKTSLIHPGLCPSITNNKAAIFIPTQAPGMVRAKAKSRSFLASACVKFKVGFLMEPY
jgi:hypothetical protein